MAERVGQQLGNYQLTRLLGEGAFAEVYLGEHVYLGSKAAIKVLHTNLANTEEIEDFSAEARTIVDLAHPHIVRLLEYGIEGGIPFLVMEYAPGGTLRQRHPRGTRLPPVTVVSYVKQVADALAYAHNQKLVHRDIKPENLLLGQQERLLVSDFGIAIIATTRHAGPQNIAGTVSYMAPEQLQGQPQRASDQYALGILSYEWLTGSVPFRGSWLEVASQHALTPPKSLREQVPDLPPAVEAVVLTALAKDPKARFANVLAFANALEQASLESLPHHAGSTSALPKQGPLIFRPSQDSGLLPPDHLVAPTLAVRPMLEDASGARQPTAVTAAPLPPTLRAPGAPLPTAPSGADSPGAPKQRGRWVQSTLLLSLIILLLAGSTLGALGLTGTGPLSFLSTSSHPIGHPSGVITEFALTANTGPGLIIAGPDGNLWFTEPSSDRLGRITPQGKITEFPILTVSSIPRALVVGRDGNLWFPEFGGNKIGRITPQGKVTEYVFPSPEYAAPFGMVVGPNGNLWFTEMGSSQIGQITPQGTITEFPIPTASSGPTDIVAGPDGNLWFTEADSNKIGRITPQGTITDYPIPTAKSLLAAIVTGPDGNLWFTEDFGDKIGRITSQGSITEYSVPSHSQPYAIITGSDGNLWFTEFGSGKIGRITPQGIITEYPIPTSSSSPDKMVIGPDGNCWFVEYKGNKIGRITPQGTITEYPIPTADSTPTDIVVGPDKNLWFVETNGNKIGRIISGLG